MEEHIKGIAVNMFNIFTNLNIVSTGLRFPHSAGDLASCIDMDEYQEL